ncbi:MAG: nicotinate-nucleotide--dimethylbenzimidazole phosphoribosyltransferase, partial [Oscillospiraceae bacterium]
MTLEQLLGQIIPPDKDAIEAAWRRWDSVAKPLRSLGLFEESVVKLAGIAGSAKVTLPRRATVVLCADNGVVAEGVTQCGCEVTALVAENMTRGLTSLCQMSRVAHADVIPVDIGIASDLSVDGLRRHKIAPGTQNIAVGPAMTRAQALDALLYGASLVCELKAQG